MGTRIRGFVGAAAVVFGFTTGAAAQSMTVHTGIVRDHTGVPVAGVVVTVQHPQETAVRVVVTDLRGKYEVPELERGIRYTVQVSHPEFRKTRVQASAGDHVTVQLKPRRSSRHAGQAATTVARQ